MDKRNDGNTLDFWRQAISEQGGSGLTVKEYCQLIEKTPFQFHYWKRRVNQAFDLGGDTKGFVELKSAVGKQGNRDFITIRIGPFTIRFADDTDEALFRKAASLLLTIRSETERA